MSSKRKNTPTKVTSPEAQKNTMTSSLTAAVDSNSDSLSENSLRIVTSASASDESDDDADVIDGRKTDVTGSAGPTATTTDEHRVVIDPTVGRPEDDDDDDGCIDLSTKSNKRRRGSSCGGRGLASSGCKRKVVEVESGTAAVEFSRSPLTESGMMEKFEAALNAEKTVEEKYRRLNEMMAELDAIKEKLVELQNSMVSPRFTDELKCRVYKFIKLYTFS